MTTKISLHDMRLYAYHGVLPEERVQGAWFRVSLQAVADCSEAVTHDTLTDTVNYAEMARITQEEMQQASQLLEHVAGRIARRILREIPRIEALTVSVHKEHPPVCVECESSSIELSLKREELHG